MKNSILIYVDNNISDDTPLVSLIDQNVLIPEELKAASYIYFTNNVFFSVPSSYKGKLLDQDNTIVREESMQKNWNMVFQKSDADNIIRIYADAPFTDFSLVKEMLEIHTKYVAEYTYSENVPSGFCCDIVSSVLVNSFPAENPEKKALPIEKVIKDNINQFDVELFYKEPDIRQKRLSFRTQDKRERKVCENIYLNQKKIPDYSEILGIIDSNPEVLYIAPSYVELQINQKSNSAPLYAHPFLNTIDSAMGLSTIKKFIEDMRFFEIPYNVSLTFGDPLLHPDIYSILKLLVSEELIETLIIETEAASNDMNFISFLEEADTEKLRIIISCNGYNEESYKQIHGTDKFDTVYGNILKIKDIIADHIYLEIKKINETEPFLDKYYDFWEKEDVQLILQKQNTYIGAVEDRKYYDLTPLKRIPCWHLQRDLYILPDGTAAFCKQDVEGKFSSLNINTMPISEIWEKRKPLFLNDYRGSLSKSPDCASCDEWFTFNL